MEAVMSSSASSSTSSISLCSDLLNDVPAYSWTRRLDKEFPLHKSFTPTLSDLWKLIGLPLGMTRYVMSEYWNGRLPIMDPFSPVSPVMKMPLMGVPCGGIGGGAITRGWRGDFLRWSILPAGIPSYKIVAPNQFSLFSRRLDDPEARPIASVLNAKSIHTSHSTRIHKIWNFNGIKGDKTTYYGAYPLAWTSYDGEPDPDLRVLCVQVSPILPGEYRKSSYPCVAFEFTIENRSCYKKEVAIMFSWANSIGGDLDEVGGHKNEQFTSDDKTVSGVLLRHNYSCKIRKEGKDIIFQDPCAMAIATPAAQGESAKISIVSRFGTQDPDALRSIWDSFSSTGVIPSNNDTSPSKKGEPIGAAISVKKVLLPGQRTVISFSLSWDAPLARFSCGEAYLRRYTRYFRNFGNAAKDLAQEALKHYPSWMATQLKWQNDIVSRTDLPSYYFCALFNELYYVSDGGTVWVEDTPVDDSGSQQSNPAREDSDSMGKFFYLEGHEYLMANTYDVHFYASFALVQLWPEIQLSIEREIARITSTGLDEKKFRHTLILGGGDAPRAVKYAVPHDIGNPGEAPWSLPNSYPIHRIDQWRDLSPKLTLQLARDYYITENRTHLEAIYPVADAAMRRSLTLFDTNKDGLIENSGSPDTTYDIWTATGASAYTGGLWLAALRAMKELAKKLNKLDDSKYWEDLYASAHTVYMKKLWNGAYFKYDEDSNQPCSSIHSDQLAGQWYALSSGLDSIINFDKAKTALKSILENNVRKFEGGRLGAVNGFFPEPLNRPDTNSMQAKEVWTGVTYALAATMVHHGLIDEAMEVIKGFVNTMFNELGYIYGTPEAVNADGSYRAITYMRPLSVWAIQLAWDQNLQRKPQHPHSFPHT